MFQRESAEIDVMCGNGSVDDTEQLRDSKGDQKGEPGQRHLLWGPLDLSFVDGQESRELIVNLRSISHVDIHVHTRFGKLLCIHSLVNCFN